jgi:hypothetical protein
VTALSRTPIDMLGNGIYTLEVIIERKKDIWLILKEYLQFARFSFLPPAPRIKRHRRLLL